jgi:hypothetical protein
MFLFNTQQIVFLYIVIFSFYMLFLVSASLPSVCFNSCVNIQDQPSCKGGEMALRRTDDSKSGYPTTHLLQRHPMEPGRMDLYWRLPRYKRDAYGFQKFLLSPKGQRLHFFFPSVSPPARVRETNIFAIWLYP